MPPWRNQHEAHTCSELSLRILLWNASYVQTTPATTQHDEMTYQKRKIIHSRRRQYSKTRAIQYVPQLRLICAQGRDYTYIIYIYMQVRFHRNIAASSLAADCNVPQRPPATIRSFLVLHLFRWYTHTHTRQDWIFEQIHQELCPVNVQIRQETN